ncbi:MAG: helical backbone metal receptor [Crocinitomicaceae bacterium]
MVVTDQIGQVFELKTPVRRIVSLVPSQTEFLHALGLEEEVVGLTKFCIHPEEWWRRKKRVGGTKNANFEKVKALEPDLIIGNKEENEKRNIDQLRSIAPVWISDIHNLEDAYAMMLALGELVGKKGKAASIVAQIKLGFSNLKPLTIKMNVLYLIWKNPWMAAGKETFIESLLNECGFENAVKESRYPSLQENVFPECDVILLSSEPYPFKEKEKLELSFRFPKAKIQLVDGEIFSWYGSRLLESPNYFQKLLTSLE